MLQRDVYPYVYMDDWDKFSESPLPKIEDFYSHLKVEEITYTYETFFSFSFFFFFFFLRKRSRKIILLKAHLHFFLGRERIYDGFKNKKFSLEPTEGTDVQTQQLARSLIICALQT